MNAILTSGALALTCGLLTAQGSDLAPAMDIDADRPQFTVDLMPDELLVKLKSDKEFLGVILVSMTSRRAQILPDEAPILMDWMVVKAGHSADGELHYDIPLPDMLPPLKEDIFFQAITLTEDEKLGVAPVLKVAAKALPAVPYYEVEGDVDLAKGEVSADLDQGWQTDADLDQANTERAPQPHDAAHDQAQAEGDVQEEAGISRRPGAAVEPHDSANHDAAHDQAQAEGDVQEEAGISRRPGAAVEQHEEQDSDDAAFDALRSRLDLEILATDSLPPYYSLMATFKAPDSTYHLDVARMEQTETGARVYLVIKRSGAKTEEEGTFLRHAGANLGAGIRDVEVFLAMDDGSSEALEFRGVRSFRIE